MSGLSQNVLYGVSRLRFEFFDNLNHPTCAEGTGFWIQLRSNKLAFITNRHNLDPRLKHGEGTSLALTRVSIELRKITTFMNAPLIEFETDFFEVENFVNCIYLHSDCDTALIFDPKFKDPKENFSPICSFHQDFIADNTFIGQHVQVMDIISFIGFPGHPSYQWWDQEKKLPIARLASIASCPDRPFVNKGIKTGNAVLVSGLSFSGSSGGPVIFHQKNNANATISPPKLLGIMSGHWWAEDKKPGELFGPHSGLSYYTMGNTILSLIESHRL